MEVEEGGETVSALAGQKDQVGPGQLRTVWSVKHHHAVTVAEQHREHRQSELLGVMGGEGEVEKHESRQNIW